MGGIGQRICVSAFEKASESIMYINEKGKASIRFKIRQG